MSGRVVHFEIPFDDGDRARRFYTGAFGWQLQELPEMGYTLVSTGPNGEQGPLEPGFINGGILQRGGQITGPVITVDVDDIDAALATIEGLGGTTVVGRQAVGEMGFTAYATDTEGNTIGLWETAPEG